MEEIIVTDTARNTGEWVPVLTKKSMEDVSVDQKQSLPNLSDKHAK